VMCTLMHLTLIHGYLLYCVANFKNWNLTFTNTMQTSHYYLIAYLLFSH
jgi:hypothetical protein